MNGSSTVTSATKPPAAHAAGPQAARTPPGHEASARGGDFAQLLDDLVAPGAPAQAAAPATRATAATPAGSVTTDAGDAAPAPTEKPATPAMPATPSTRAGVKPGAGRENDQVAAPNLPGGLGPQARVRPDDAAAGDESADLRALDPEPPSTGDGTEPETPLGAPVVPPLADRGHAPRPLATSAGDGTEPETPLGAPVVPPLADRGHAPRPLATSAASADALPTTDVAVDRRSTSSTLHATAARAEPAAGETVERAPKPDLDARSLVVATTPTGGDGAEAASVTTPLAARSLGADALVSPPPPASPATPAPAADALLAATGVAASDAGSVSAPAPPAEARLPHPPQSPAFAAALGQQVSLWIRRGVQQAVLQLNPAELGPVAIHIALDGARAHVDFAAPHAATRAALEGSLPVLAGALRDSGLTLAGGGVFDRPREQADGSGQAPAWSGSARSDDAGRGTPLPPPVVPQRRGVVDLVA